MLCYRRELDMVFVLILLPTRPPFPSATQTTRKTTDHEPPTPPPIAPPHYHRIINEIMSGKRLSFVIASSAIGRWGRIVDVVEIVVVLPRTLIKCTRENDRVAPDVNCA